MSSNLPQRILRSLSIIGAVFSAVALAGFLYGTWFCYAEGYASIAISCLGYGALAALSLGVSGHLRRLTAMPRQMTPTPRFHVSDPL
jgi:hypothetical protein